MATTTTIDATAKMTTKIIAVVTFDDSDANDSSAKKPKPKRNEISFTLKWLSVVSLAGLYGPAQIVLCGYIEEKNENTQSSHF